MSVHVKPKIRDERSKGKDVKEMHVFKPSFV
jgi:hypothetical protein